MENGIEFRVTIAEDSDAFVPRSPSFPLRLLHLRGHLWGDVVVRFFSLSINPLPLRLILIVPLSLSLTLPQIVTFEGASMGKLKVGPASFALFSSRAIASLPTATAPDSTPLHPYAFYGTSYTPLDNVQQQLMRLLQCWSARHVFALRELAGTSQLLMTWHINVLGRYLEEH